MKLLMRKTAKVLLVVAKHCAWEKVRLSRISVGIQDSLENYSANQKGTTITMSSLEKSEASKEAKFFTKAAFAKIMEKFPEERTRG